jgi:hypothetical protein
MMQSTQTGQAFGGRTAAIHRLGGKNHPERSVHCEAVKTWREGWTGNLSQQEWVEPKRHLSEATLAALSGGAIPLRYQRAQSGAD